MNDIDQRIFNAFHDCNELLLQDEIENIKLALEKQGLLIAQSKNKIDIDEIERLARVIRERCDKLSKSNPALMHDINAIKANAGLIILEVIDGI